MLTVRRGGAVSKSECVKHMPQCDSRHERRGGDSMEGTDSSQTAWNCSDWYAWHDHEPPGPATLRVTGKCEFRTTGYKVKLKRREPQGINPKDLLLDLIVEEPP